MNGSLVSGEGKVTVVPVGASSSRPKSRCCRAHLNTLWSVWYGLTAAAVQAYIASQALLRFFEYLALAWPAGSSPRLELHAYAALTGAAVLILPLFLASALFKVGNLANDGYKLGRSVSSCSADPSGIVALGGGGPRGFWRHSAPTAAFLHVVSALCLLLPRLLIEARLIQAGFLSKDLIWRTDLDLVVGPRDGFVVLSFMTSPPSNGTILPTTLTQNTTTLDGPQSLPLSVGVPSQELTLNDNLKWGPVSPEVINYAVALLVYAVRYPAVFWNTNKWFGTLFSIQLIINSGQCLLMYAGFSVLYKVHVVGPAEALPLLYQRVGLSPNMPQHFLLNRDVTLALFVFSTLLVLKSSLVLYLYGYSRLNAFVNRERARRVISLHDSETGRAWGYFTHCAALAVLIAMAVCEAPLLYDCTVVYRGSLNAAVLACVIAAVAHLFLWVLLWLILTVKQHWQFKLRVTVGRAAVRTARSIRLVTEVDLLSSTDYAQPLLVIGNGRTYTVTDNSPKKAIMGVIQKCAIEKKARGNQDSSNAKDWMDREEEQIYWLRPKQVTPKHSPDSSSSVKLDWLRKPVTTKHKVTFDTSSKGCRSSKALNELDDGDYARLREIPTLSTACHDHSDGDTASEDNKVTPRCLRRADSGMPHEELTPRSDSENSNHSPPENSEPGGSPPDHSETSSGVHSNSSRGSTTTSQSQRRSTSVDDLATDAANKVQVPWRSVSLQRGMPPPQPDQTYSQYRAQVMSVDSTYGILRNGAAHKEGMSTYSHVAPRVTTHPQEPIYAPYRPQQLYMRSPPVISEEEDVVIRRRVSTAEETAPVSTTSTDSFGRSTNMRLTSFTDRPQQSATLPHYPTQVVNPAYPHCSTMPLPVSNPVIPTLLGAGTSCNSFSRPHTTIPTHHNGVRLFNPSPYSKRLYPLPLRGYPTPEPGHHSFPQIMNFKQNVQHKSERDSANFSLASSGDSDAQT